MNSSTQNSLIDDLHEALTRDRRDVVVMQAITNVTDRQPMDRWWQVSPGDRTKAIYDEIRRLDQARAHGTFALAERNAETPRNQAA
jgi:hypothetical protein